MVSDSLRTGLQVAIHSCIFALHKNQFCIEGAAEMEMPEHYQDDLAIFADVQFSSKISSTAVSYTASTQNYSK